MNNNKHKKNTQRGLEDTTPSSEAVTEELFMEWNFLRILGIYFCPNKNKVRELSKSKPVEFHDTTNDPQQPAHEIVRILPNAVYGYPGEGAMHTFFASLQLFLEAGYPIPREIYFFRRHILRLTHTSPGGFQLKKLKTYLRQLRGTMIEARRYDKTTGEWLFRPFSLFSDMHLTENDKKVIKRGYIELDKELHENINAFYGLRVFAERLTGLNATEKLLYIKLFNSFSLVLKKHKNRQTMSYNKAYNKLLAEWLPHHKVLSSCYDIRRDQLGPALDTLVEQGFLKQWRIEKNKANTFICWFSPGITFFADYDRIRKHPLQTRIPIDGEKQRSLFKDQKELLTYFFKKRDGAPVPDIFNDNDHKFATFVLQKITLDEAKDFVSYALDKRAPETNYKPAFFKGIEQYFMSYLKVREKRAGKQREQQEEQRQRLYARFQEDTIKLVRANISAETLSKLQEESLSEVQEQLSKTPFLAKRTSAWAATKVDNKIASLCGLVDFEEWKEAVKKGRPYSPNDFLRKIP